MDGESDADGESVSVIDSVSVAVTVTLDDTLIRVVATPQSVVDKPPHLLNIQAACQRMITNAYAVASTLQVPFSQRAAITSVAVGAIL